MFDRRQPVFGVDYSASSIGPIHSNKIRRHGEDDELS